MEGYRSGHNGAVLKTVRAKVHAGSNPAPSAKTGTPAQRAGVPVLESKGAGFESCPQATQVACMSQCKHWRIPLFLFPVPARRKEMQANPAPSATSPEILVISGLFFVPQFVPQILRVFPGIFFITACFHLRIMVLST